MSAPVVLIGGTGSFLDPLESGLGTDAVPWHHPASRFVVNLTQHDVPVVGEPFIWCGGLDGVIGRHRHWISAGMALRWYSELIRQRLAVKSLSYVAHSHGAQIVFAAASLAGGLPTDTLVTLGAPVRTDYSSARVALRRTCRRWIDVWSPEDTVQPVGAWDLDRQRGFPEADHEIVVGGLDPATAHSDLHDVVTWRRWDWARWFSEPEGVLPRLQHVTAERFPDPVSVPPETA